MKNLKTILCSLLMFCLIVPACLMLSACGNNNSVSSDRVMSLSINPELSFVVDKDNKIVSISYEGSEDAGTIYANVNFEGMKVEDAIKVFIENAAISGHIGLSGNTANDFEITVNGSIEADIAALEALAKSEVEKTFSNLGVEVEVVISNLTESELKNELVEKAEQLYNEYTESELSKMTRAELVELIKSKQKEYKDLTLAQINELKAEISTTLADSSSSLALLKKAIVDTKLLLDNAQENFDSAKEIGLNLGSLQGILDNAKVAYEEALKAFAEAEKLLIEAKEALAEAEKIELLADFRAEIELNETTIRNWLDSAYEEGDLTSVQCDYWLNLINTNKGVA